MALCFSVGGSLSGPRGLLEVQPLPGARPSWEAAQAGVQVGSSGAFWPSSSSWGWAMLLKARGRLRERLRRES